MIVGHNMGVHKVTLRKDLLPNGAETRSLTCGVIAAQDTRAIPVFGDTDWDTVRFDSCLEVLEILDEVVAVVLVADWFGAELYAVKDVRSNVAISAV